MRFPPRAAYRGDGNTLNQPARTIVLALVALLTLSGCLRDSERDNDRNHSPTIAAASPTAIASPSPSATASQTVTSTATVAPATQASSPTPDNIPTGQEEDLPNVTLHYGMDVTLVDFDAGHVEAGVTVRVTSGETAPLAQLFFRVPPARDRFFTLASLTRDGAPAEAIATDEGTTLAVALDPPLTPGATTELRFEFTLMIGQITEGFASTGRDGPVLRLGYWYPMLSNDDGYPKLLDPPYTLSADFSITLNLPDDVVVAAAALPRTDASDAGRREITYTLERGRDFAFMFSREFALHERAVAGGTMVQLFTVSSLFGGGDLAAQKQTRESAFSIAERALLEYTANVGPYPWPSLAIVEGGQSLGGGIEYTALTIINFESGDIKGLIAHEIAHMWFYAAIGTRTQADPWIDEGAATFLANCLVSSCAASINADNGGNGYATPLSAGIADLVGLPSADWIAAIYSQGASFYAEVMFTLGPERFWGALRALYTTEAFGIATPYEVLTLFEQFAPEGADVGEVFGRYFAYGWV